MRLAALAAAVVLAGCASPAALRDCASCPEMVVVPAGTAVFGAAEEDPLHQPDELPERRITIDRPFAVSRHEVTRAQYEAFVAATRRPIEGHCLTDRAQRGHWQIDAGTTLRDPGFVQAGNEPVVCVSWHEAQAYADWLSAQTGQRYRLLSEVEWEYVARAGATRNTRYPWGDDAAPGCAYANAFDSTALAHYAGMDTSGYKLFDPLPCDDGRLRTAPVGSFAANAFGVHDMIGNVSEWVEDCHTPSHAAPAAAAAPCARRVAKGGSWGTLAHNLRTAERFPYAPTHRDDSIGIRVAKTLAQPTD